MPKRDTSGHTKHTNLTLLPEDRAILESMARASGETFTAVVRRLLRAEAAKADLVREVQRDMIRKELQSTRGTK